MRGILNKNDCIKYLHETWSGEVRGPITTLEFLMQHDGYFEIPHLLLTYMEYLAGLFTGKGPNANPSDTKKFIQAYFPSKYQHAGSWLIVMYRHGLTHEYAPKCIEYEGQIIGWCCDLGTQNIREHLKIVPTQEPHFYQFWICAHEFLKDFKLAIQNFKNDILKDDKRFENFKKAFNNHQKPEEYNTVCKKTKILFLKKIKIG